MVRIDHSVACPELAEGKAEQANCVSPKHITNRHTPYILTLLVDCQRLLQQRETAVKVTTRIESRAARDLHVCKCECRGEGTQQGEAMGYFAA
jgi:hypothetical protein